MSEAKSKVDESVLSDLLCVARTVELLAWATHVAVRKDGSKAEPAAWLEKVKDYLDEDPSQLGKNRWATGHKHYYWTFFSRAQLNT